MQDIYQVLRVYSFCRPCLGYETNTCLSQSNLNNGFANRRRKKEKKGVHILANAPVYNHIKACIVLRVRANVYNLRNHVCAL